MKKILLIAGALVALAVPSWGAAAIGAAFGNISGGGVTINAAKQGTNTLYIQGAVTSKPGGKPTLVITGPPEFDLDATVGATNPFDVALFSAVTVCKSDASATGLTIFDSASRYIPLAPLSVQWECATLSRQGGVWHVK
jgi:hypothetical protein